jgi:general secretion pathway protein C
MDLAKTLAHWRDQPPEQWITQANRLVPPIVVAVLIILMAARAAELTWRLLEAPAEQSVVPAPTAAARGAGGGAASGALDALAGWHPFGEPPAPDAARIPAEDVLDAPETSLNLTLNGTLQYQELPQRGSTILPEAGTAVIASGRGTQKVYKTGDSIEGGNGATLHSVYHDRVMLDPGGGRPLEKLSYPKPDQVSQRPTGLNSNLSVATQRQTRPTGTPGAASSLTESMGQVASTLGQVMRITQQAENGQIIGFRLQPQGDGQAFAELGFEPGDILTEVNGLKLNDARGQLQVLQALSETSQAQVTVRRNGADRVLVIDIGQVQRLADSLQ